MVADLGRSHQQTRFRTPAAERLNCPPSLTLHSVNPHTLFTQLFDGVRRLLARTFSARLVLDLTDLRTIRCTSVAFLLTAAGTATAGLARSVLEIRICAPRLFLSAKMGGLKTISAIVASGSLTGRELMMTTAAGQAAARSMRMGRGGVKNIRLGEPGTRLGSC